MKDLIGAIFTLGLIGLAFHYGSLLLGIGAVVMTLNMIGRFDTE
jgi:hypothetical protein